MPGRFLLRPGITACILPDQKGIDPSSGLGIYLLPIDRRKACSFLRKSHKLFTKLIAENGLQTFVRML